MCKISVYAGIILATQLNLLITKQSPVKPVIFVKIHFCACEQIQFNYKSGWLGLGLEAWVGFRVQFYICADL